MIAFNEDGQWYSIQLDDLKDHEPPKPEPQQLTTIAPLDPLDEIGRHIGHIIRLARGLSSDHARRSVRDMMHAAQGALSARTYLDNEDQERFERGLRNAAM